MKKRRKKYFGILLCTAIVLGVGLRFGLMERRPTAAAIAPARFSGATLVVDAGHGGEDGGAVSPGGTVESNINLAIALRLDALMGLYGVNVHMLRDSDTSLHSSEAETLRQKKVSDLHNRVDMIEATENATVISIHQNSYPGSRYHGAQVFFAPTEGSAELASVMQETLRLALDESNGRQPTKIPDTVYLMNHITCRAILVECGFLTNAEEEQLLCSASYQTKLAAALCGAYLQG